jgi:hypothetical protein
VNMGRFRYVHTQVDPCISTVEPLRFEFTLRFPRKRGGDKGWRALKL